MKRLTGYATSGGNPQRIQGQIRITGIAGRIAQVVTHGQVIGSQPQERKKKQSFAGVGRRTT